MPPAAPRPLPRPLLSLLLLCLCAVPLAAQPTHVSWAQESAANSGPGLRAGVAYSPQALSTLAGGVLADVLWMFGGISSTLPLSYSDELWSYRRTDNSSSWALMPPGSSAIDRPTPRVGSALCAVGHFIYVYGGASFAANAHADLYRFDTAQRQWLLQLPPGTAPGALAYHAMSCVGGTVYLSGGEDASGTLRSSTYALLDAGNPALIRWSSPVMSGAPPTARRGHSLTAADNSRLVLFGGRGPSGSFLNDAYLLRTGTLEWVSLATLGARPAGREGHVAVVLSERLYVFGGADALGSRNDVVSLDLSSLIWSYPAAAGTLPTPRWGTLGAKLNEKLYVYGGLSTSSQLLGDMWSMSRQCHGRVHLRASRATFASGEGVYGPNARCEWLIAPTAPDRQVRLFFSAFGLEDGADYVRVYDGTEASRPLLAAFTGQGLPQSLVSSNGSLLVVMTTDGSTQDVGFRASYSSECAEGFRPSFTNPTTDDTCYPCSPGTYAPSPGLRGCTPCPSHEFQPAYGQSSCLECAAASRAPYEGAHAASECLCYVGFHSPGGLGTGCVACPNGAECPGGASEAIVHVGFCRYNATHTKPCCEPDQCRGGTDAVCPTDVGAAGADECVEFLILTFGVNTFIIVCAVVLGAALCMGLLTYYFGRRAGIAYGLRDYMRQLHLSSVGPKLGSEIHAYTSNFEMQTQAPSNRRRGFEVLERITEEPAGVGMVDASTTGTAPRDPRNPARLLNAALRDAPKTYMQVPVVSLEAVQTLEARLCAASPSAAAAEAPVPPLSLSTLQQAEADLFPPSTAGHSFDARSADARSAGAGVGGLQQDGASTYGGSLGEVEPAPPTPPRAKNRLMINTGAPNNEGRWSQPIKWTSSMQASPVGSFHPSLAPSEGQSVAGRSARYTREGQDGQ